MSDSLISIIVPVYNSEKTLNRCIDSILGQTYRNFELLLINDGSLDCSGEICDEYAQQDSRVKVFHKENGGVSSARNLGLDNARGEWIVFVDSDDWVDEEYLSSLYDAAISLGCSIVACDFVEINKDGTKRCNSFDWAGNNKVEFNNLNRAEALKAIYCYSYGVIWNILVSRNLIDAISARFDSELKNGEDTLFLCKLYLGANKYYHLRKYLYFYDRTNEFSASNNKTIDYHLNRLNFACKIQALFSNARLGIPLDFVYLGLIGCCYQLLVAPSFYPVIREALTLLPNGFLLRAPGVPFKRKVVLWLILNNHTFILRRLIMFSPHYIKP